MPISARQWPSLDALDSEGLTTNRAIEIFELNTAFMKVVMEADDTQRKTKI
jgi:hypothetical protein